MKTSEDKVVWALKFAAQKSLSSLQNHEWQKLTEEIRSFVKWPGGAEKNWLADQLTRGNITALHDEVKEFLKYAGLSTSITRIYKDKAVGGSSLWSRPFKTIQGFVLCYSRGRRTYQISVDANLAETFLFVLGIALSAIDYTALFLCPACGNPFLATHGSQKHCSKRCSSSKALRDFRERQRQAKKQTAKIRGRVPLRKPLPGS